MRPFPQYTNFNAVLYDATGIYHSFQTNFARRFAKGFSLDAIFHLVEEHRYVIGLRRLEPDALAVPGDRARVSALDRPFMTNVGWIWELPFGKGQQFPLGSRVGSALLGGWN